MIHIFRQHQRIIMLVIAVLTIVAFIWLYNPAQPNELGTNHVATIYGRTLTQADIDREVRNYGLALALGQIPLITKLGGNARSQDEMLINFVWNLQVLQHESKVLGIEPTQNQIGEVIKKLPVFQTDGQFDSLKYAKFTEEQLGPRGFTQMQLEKVIGDSLRLERIEELVASPAVVSEGTLQEGSRIYQKENLQVVRFDLQKAMDGVSVTESEVQNYFSRNQAMWVAPEARVVEYVAFALPEADAKLEGKARVEALQKLADSAARFVEKAMAAGASFAGAAQEAGLTPVKTPEFERSGRPTGDSAQPDPVLADLAPAAFLLAESNPVSDPIQAGDGFLVARLSSVRPARPLSFKEARSAVEKAARGLKARQALKESAGAALAKIRQAVKGGQTFEQAAQAEGLTVEKHPDVTPMETQMDSPIMPAVRLSVGMQPGDISGFIPAEDGGFAVYLESRTPLSNEEFARLKDTISTEMLQASRALLFQNWMYSAREAAKIVMARQGAAN